MIKLVLSGLWVCAVTVASSFAVVSWQSGHAPEAKSEKYFGGLDYVKTKMISVPIIADGDIQGYVLAQFVFTIEAKLLRRLSIKPDVFLVDEAIKAIYASDRIDFRKPKKQDLPTLAKMIGENVNKRFGARFVEEVLVQELNYVPKDQARDRAAL